MLSKSNDLGLSALSMNTHYLKLKNYLAKVERNPKIVLNQAYHVFQSEDRLYGTDQKTNHRIKPRRHILYQNLFKICQDDYDGSNSLVSFGALAMKEKLESYAHRQLPGGIYWNPDQKTQEILSCLRPSNDICESVLGVNDYLTTAIPNLSQMGRSNLIQLKRNKR